MIHPPSIQTERLLLRRVMEKVGMKKEGVLGDHVLKDDRYHSIVAYGIIYFI